MKRNTFRAGIYWWQPIRLECVMADEDKEPAPPPVLRPRNNNALFGPQDSFVPPPLQQPVWVPDMVWDMPHQQRNNALLDSPSSFVPPPMDPPPADARDDEINDRFQDVLRRQAELSLSVDRLRDAIAASSSARVIGPGHNQGPPFQIEELDAESHRLLALLQDNGPRPTPVDRALIVEQAEETLRSGERIRTWQANLAAEAAKLGAREVVKDLTAQLWQEVASRILDFYHAIIAWISSLPL
jgi:hypothetical protein